MATKICFSSIHKKSLHLRKCTNQKYWNGRKYYLFWYWKHKGNICILKKHTGGIALDFENLVNMKLDNCLKILVIKKEMIYLMMDMLINWCCYCFNVLVTQPEIVRSMNRTKSKYFVLFLFCSKRWIRIEFYQIWNMCNSELLICLSDRGKCSMYYITRFTHLLEQSNPLMMFYK